jgi:hypothetical protein
VTCEADGLHVERNIVVYYYNFLVNLAFAVPYTRLLYYIAQR